MVGDAVNTTGAVYQICQRFPNAEIVLGVGAAAAGVFENFPGLTEIWPRKRHRGIPGRVKDALNLRTKPFDLGILLDDNNTKAETMVRGGIKRLVGMHRTKHQDSFLASVPNPQGGHDLFEGLQAVLSLLGCDLDIQPRLFPSKQDQERAANLLPTSSIVLHLGASDPRKQWPTERFAELANHLTDQGQPVLIAAGPGEGALLEEIKPLVHNANLLTTATSLLTYAEILRRATTTVVADTGPAHLAAAVGTPAIVLYGPTNPTRFHPYGAQRKLLFHNLGCHHYDHFCIAEKESGKCDFRCMRAISVEEVLQAIREVIEN